MDKKLLQELSDFAQEQEAAQKSYGKSADALWESLDKQQQLMLFYSVVKRIVQGELTEQGSYRHVLYNTFGFGPEAYGIGMDCGFLSLHNAIVVEDNK